jgi:hypothetical protein
VVVGRPYRSGTTRRPILSSKKVKPGNHISGSRVESPNQACFQALWVTTELNSLYSTPTLTFGYFVLGIRGGGSTNSAGFRGGGGGGDFGGGGGGGGFGLGGFVD